MQLKLLNWSLKARLDEVRCGKAERALRSGLAPSRCQLGAIRHVHCTLIPVLNEDMSNIV